MGGKRFSSKELFDGKAIGTAAIAFLILCILWRKLGRVFKKNEPYDRQKTLIKFAPIEDSIALIRDVSGLGLSVVHFVIDSYPGICCLMCGPIFHVNVIETDIDFTCKCSLCSVDLSPVEKKQMKAFMDQYLSPSKLAYRSVMCTNNRYGCNVIIPLKELKEHIQHCAFTRIQCPYMCGTAIERQHLERHAKLCRNVDYIEQQTNPPYPTVTEPLPGIVPSCPPPPYESS